MRTTGWTAALLLGSTVLWAQATPPAGPAPAGQKQSTAGAGPAKPTAVSCQQLMQRHEQTMSDLEQMDAKLYGLVEKMNAAKGEARIDAAAAVINELMRQRRQVHERMTADAAMMSAYAMQHMSQGAGGAHCPLLETAMGAAIGPPTPER
jgi:TolA-binding protein